jgi:hypothetical protein
MLSELQVIAITAELGTKSNTTYAFFLEHIEIENVITENYPWMLFAFDEVVKQVERESSSVNNWTVCCLIFLVLVALIFLGASVKRLINNKLEIINDIDFSGEDTEDNGKPSEVKIMGSAIELQKVRD